MLISELSPFLKGLCHKRQIEQGNDGTFEGPLTNGKNSYNFNWDETPEDYKFWSDLDENDEFYVRQKYPHIFQIFEIY